MQDPEQESEYFTDKPMNIYSEPGSMVRYAFPSNALDSEQVHANEHLVPGVLYTVKQINRRISISYIELEEVPGEFFNTVLFADGSKF